jgi:hypothetical protein
MTKYLQEERPSFKNVAKQASGQLGFAISGDTVQRANETVGSAMQRAGETVSSFQRDNETVYIVWIPKGNEAARRNHLQQREQLKEVAKEVVDDVVTNALDDLVSELVSKAVSQENARLQTKLDAQAAKLDAQASEIAHLRMLVKHIFWTGNFKSPPGVTLPPDFAKPSGSISVVNTGKVPHVK